ncbi:hypothetical protein KBC03_06785 [Patescibacteria group bacterium]|nr:hypothetical protein [Patescibacteria group bacterium]
MIILGFMLLLVFLIMAIRLNNMIAKASHVVSLVSQYVLLPFSYLTTLFARSEEKKAARKTKKSNSGEK